MPTVKFFESNNKQSYELLFEKIQHKKIGTRKFLSGATFWGEKITSGATKKAFPFKAYLLWQKPTNRDGQFNYRPEKIESNLIMDVSFDLIS